MIKMLTFADPSEFAEYVANQPALGTGPRCVFRDSSAPGGRAVAGTETEYATLIPVQDGNIVAVALDLSSHYPTEWGKMLRDGKLHTVCNTKKKLIEFLRKIDVADEDIKKLSKTKVSSLREIVDKSTTSPKEDEDFEELLHRTRNKNDTITLYSATFGTIQLTLRASRYPSRSLVYEVTADWSSELAALLASVHQELAQRDIKCFEGRAR